MIRYLRDPWIQAAAVVLLVSLFGGFLKQKEVLFLFSLGEVSDGFSVTGPNFNLKDGSSGIGVIFFEFREWNLIAGGRSWRLHSRHGQ